MRHLPIWLLLLAGVPVGIAVVAFLAIHWPWGLLVLVLLLVYAGIVAKLSRPRANASLLGESILFVAFMFVALFTSMGVFLTVVVPQMWLPLPVLGGLGVLAAVLGAALVLIPGRG